MSRSRLFVAPVLLVTLLGAAPSPAAETEAWPTFRGPDMRGVYVGDVFADEAVGLEVAWKRALGSGYSSISLAGGRGVTLYTDGETDFLTAFDAATGDEIWRYAIAEMYAGHDGSDDGPIGTPLVHDGTVYALGPHGQLVAVRLDDGQEVWKHVLSEADSRPPHYGYSTTPLMVGDRLVVETGGADGHSITAFDRATGRKLWSHGDDTVNHQSPIAATVAGRAQILAATDRHLLGLDPATGEELWRYAHAVTENYQAQHPIDLGDGRFLLSFQDEAAAVKVTAGDGGYAVEELWRNNSFRSLALPVLHEGYLYGFANRYLSCVEAATGERVWRSRPPGGLALILVDGHLVILSLQGELVVARATPEGYDERARLPLFERTSYTPASYAGGRLYLRNLDEMASVRITAEAMTASAPPAEEPEPPRGVLAELAAKTAAAPSDEARKRIVDDFLAAQTGFPIHEDGGLVHLVYRGEAEDVAVTGTVAPGGELALHRLAGTDLFWRSFEFDPAGHWEYAFSVDFGDRRITDPLNPHNVEGLGFQPLSELRMPEWRVPTHLAEPEGPRGEVDTFQFHSEARGNVREIQVYMPPGYGESEDRYPLLVVHHGNYAVRAMLYANTLDNLIAQGRIEPLIVAFVPRVSGAEYSVSPDGDAYLRFVTEELLPHLDRHYRTQSDPAKRGAMGVGSAGLISVYSALKAPGTFGRFATQSFYMPGESGSAIPELIAAAQPAAERFYVEWSRNDYQFPGVDAQADSQALAAALEERGFTVSAHEIEGTVGFGSWRGQTDLILEYLYPKTSVLADEPGGPR